MKRLAVFARAPVAGQVKSRLSPALPVRLAAALYAGLLADAFTAVDASAADERYAYWADDPGPAPDRLIACAQHGADLGARLHHAFCELLTGDDDRALVLGSDTPGLTAVHVDAALAALDSHDVVLGPTPDGGYWCIGLKRRTPSLFAHVPWSTEQVLACTLEKARAAGLAVALTTELDDLDTPQDLARLVGALATREAACGTHAQAALGTMGLRPAPHA